MPNDKGRINIDSPTGHPTCNIQDLLSATISARAECDGKRTGFQRKLEIIISSLQQYSPIINVLTQQDTDITVIVWGALRLLIGVSAQEI